MLKNCPKTLGKEPEVHSILTLCLYTVGCFLGVLRHTVEMKCSPVWRNRWTEDRSNILCNIGCIKMSGWYSTFDRFAPQKEWVCFGDLYFTLLYFTVPFLFCSNRESKRQESQKEVQEITAAFSLGFRACDNCLYFLPGSDMCCKH